MRPLCPILGPFCTVSPLVARRRGTVAVLGYLLSVLVRFDQSPDSVFAQRSNLLVSGSICETVPFGNPVQRRHAHASSGMVRPGLGRVFLDADAKP